MRVLPVPSVDSADVVKMCLDATADQALLARLQVIVPDLAESATQYQKNAEAGRLDLQGRNKAVGDLTKEELIKLYESHLSAMRGAARGIYDQIKNAAPQKKCPLCGVGLVVVLDHHLPKAKYPDLSIVPANLVPACLHCNNAKKAHFPRCAEEQTLHPYYDARLIGARWLAAAIDRGPPMVVTYSAAPPDTWTSVDRQRVNRHFKVCGIGEVFAMNANNELVTLKPWLASFEKKGGSDAVKNYLNEQASLQKNCPNYPNNWQFSLYDALVNDSWFIDGGFHSIPHSDQ